MNQFNPKPVSASSEPKVDREFRLSLTIQDNPDFDGLHVIIALGQEEDKDTPILMVQGGGVPASEEGAGLIADMLRDAADAIDDHLGKERVHTHTDSMPIIKRPRFNPRPAGGRGR